MDEQVRYYFYNGVVETATAIINGWQELTKEEIQLWLTGDYEVQFTNNIYSLILRKHIVFDLEQYKLDRIKDLSNLSLSIGEIIAPSYIFNNCILSKEMELIGEIPIYVNWRDVLNDYKNKRIALRNEFYKLKNDIENFSTKEEIDVLFENNLFVL